MKYAKGKFFSSVIAVSLISGGLLGLGVSSAQAACNGENSYKVVSSDPLTGGQTAEVKVDSCKVQQLIDSYGQVKDAAGLAGLLGAGYWPVGVTGGLFYGWAWLNQGLIKDCANAGSGIKFREINGIVSGCSGQ
jgi:hypothetical protein